MFSDTLNNRVVSMKYNRSQSENEGSQVENSRWFEFLGCFGFWLTGLANF